MDNARDLKKSESSMLKYCKVVLDRISFDRKLLIKEYRKSLKWLSREESTVLKAWMRIRFKGKLSIIQNQYNND